ncbi:2978_t:CDS:1 [Paraglomus occultum]|uniref:2978_t:CDS:1 n=1 Tax=Paraglomus occultum TaxID=144539 RepID=A0A9N9B408_9GLOM|nr:2978_t:CDS:1 [Paraglomus occultum]
MVCSWIVFLCSPLTHRGAGSISQPLVRGLAGILSSYVLELDVFETVVIGQSSGTTPYSVSSMPRALDFLSWKLTPFLGLFLSRLLLICQTDPGVAIIIETKK